MRAAVRTVVVCAALLLWAAPAAAHSFLAATDPAQGARLSVAPDTVALQFSEEVALGAVQLALRRSGTGGDHDLPAPRLESGGAVVRQPLPVLDSGIYVVSWQVTSAVDGHDSAGELAFAVRTDPADAVPQRRAAIPDVDPAATALAWVFYAGLSVTTAGIAARWLGGGEHRWHPRWVRGGALIALVAVAVRIVLVPVVSTAGPAGMPMTAAAAALGLALALAEAARPRLLAGLVVTAGVAWAARSHSAAAHGLVGMVLDAVHLLAAVTWTGGLAAVVLTLWRSRQQGSTPPQGMVRQYARWALAVVGVVSVSGLTQAALLLPGWAALWSTPYGRVLLVKTGMLLTALSAAAVARTWGLPAMRLRLLRRVTATELWLLAGVLSAAALLVTTPPPTSTDHLESLLGPPPITGPTVRAMDLAGSLTIDVVAGAERLDVSVISPSGGVEGAVVDISAVYPGRTRAELHPRPCGPGCFTMQHTLPDGDTVLQISAEAPDWTGGPMQASLQWPPAAEVPERVDRMIQAMRTTEEIVLTEAVTSSSHDRDPIAREVSLTGEQLVALMPWGGGGVVDVRPLDGRADAFSFHLTGSQMRFEVVIDVEGRLVRQRMVNPGHEIRYTFSYPS